MSLSFFNLNDVDQECACGGLGNVFFPNVTTCHRMNENSSGPLTQESAPDLLLPLEACEDNSRSGRLKYQAQVDLSGLSTILGASSY